MMPDEIAAVVDGTRIVIDLSAWQLARHAVWLTVSIVLSIAAFVVCVVVVEPGRRRRLVLGLVGGAVGGALALAAAPVVLGVFGRWLPDLGSRVSQGSLLAAFAGAGVGAVLTALPITFLSSTRPRASWLACVVVIVAAIVGVVGVVRAQSERREILAALRDADPLPRLRFVGDAGDAPLPEVHVGRTKLLKPERVTQLQTSGSLFASTPTVTANTVGRWNVDEVRAALTANTAGQHEAIAVARRGIVRVEQPVRFIAIDDTAPSAFPLAAGTRFSWWQVRGDRGVVDKTEAALKAAAAKKKPTTTPTVTASAVVLDDRIDNGLRIARVQTVIDGQTSTTDVIARNGQLVRAVGGPFLTIEAGSVCTAPFLGFDSCRCTSKGIERCSRHDGDRLGSAVRVGMAVATGGLSELFGACRGCGEGREEGLLLQPRR